MAGRLGEAEVQLRHATGLLERRVPETYEFRWGLLALLLSGRARVLEAQGKLAEAEQALRRAMEAHTRQLEVDRQEEGLPAQNRQNLEWWCASDQAQLFFHLGRVLAVRGEPRAAEEAYVRGLALWRGVPAKDRVYPGDEARLEAGLADLLFDTGRREEARALYRHALEGPARIRAGLLATCPDAQLRDPRKAVELALVEVAESAKNPDRHDPAYAWRELGVAYAADGAWARAGEALDKARTLAEQRYPKRDKAEDALDLLERVKLSFGGTRGALFVQAMADWQRGRQEQARRRFDRAARSMEAYPSRQGEMRRFRAAAAAMLGVAERPAK
jgi:tetratricopeptide (TPR) repeat protein